MDKKIKLKIVYGVISTIGTTLIGLISYTDTTSRIIGTFGIFLLVVGWYNIGKLNK